MQDDLNVSRETLERLKHYQALLEKWNPVINLVAKSTIEEAWTRHIIDSAQVFKLAKENTGHWADIGSGGGFPGIVVAIMAAEKGYPNRTTLVESDNRKATFLRTVLRETGVKADVKSARIEQLDPLNADTLSARALADLDTLLSFAEQHLSKDGTALFHKGINWKKELEVAQTKWQFDHEVVKSRTGDGPVILRISGVSRV